MNPGNKPDSGPPGKGAPGAKTPGKSRQAPPPENPAASHNGQLEPEEDKSWIALAGASLLGHIALFCAVVFLPQIARPVHMPTPFIDVSLVAPGPVSQPRAAARPATPKAPEAPKVQQKPPEPVVPEPVQPAKPVVKAEPPKPQETAPVKAPEVSLAEKDAKPTQLSSLKKTTFKPDAVKQKALREMEKRVETQRPNAVQEAIEKFRKDPGKAPAAQEAASPGGEGSGTGRGQASFQQIALANYAELLKEHIMRNWVVPERLFGTDLSAIIMVTIRRDGAIEDMIFETRSKDRFFDDSAERAVRKSDPAPPFPAAVSQAAQSFNIEFIPPH